MKDLKTQAQKLAEVAVGLTDYSSYLDEMFGNPLKQVDELAKEAKEIANQRIDTNTEYGFVSLNQEKGEVIL